MENENKTNSKNQKDLLDPITEIAQKEADMQVGNVVRDLVEQTSSMNKPISEVINSSRTAESNIVDVLHKTAIVSEVKNDEKIRKQIVDQAHKTIDQNIKKIDSENTARTQQAVYDVNKEACNCYGIENSVPTWEVRLMRFGHSLWFVIYWLFATLTICPINVFAKGIKAFIKNSWIAIITAILCYLLITVGLPILIAWLNKHGFQTIFNSETEDEIVQTAMSFLSGVFTH